MYAVHKGLSECTGRRWCRIHFLSHTADSLNIIQAHDIRRGADDVVHLGSCCCESEGDVGPYLAILRGYIGATDKIPVTIKGKLA